ncbi:hypothetical protein A4A49_54787 [Nicotiana attenuata]|uniref:Uncharacterized protein n=1 Tax=Nicotiana attenuata TaxID=49451 RepID=A0A1J6KUM6_NICAT|nr:hypothetical protein A4A49_54787 [Nicotiana attenuata]
MNAGAKKKGLNPNKAQSPMKKIGFDFQFRSSAELAKQFQIKKEKLAHDKEHKIVKEQAPVTHKRKHLMPTISNVREGQSRQRLIQLEESFQQQGNGKLPMHKSIIQLSSKEALNTSHMIGRRQGEGEICKKVKRKPVLSATSLDHFLKKNGIYVGGEKQPDNQPVDGFRSIPSPLVDEHNIELDDFAAQEEVGEDECVRDEAMDVDSATGGTSDKKKVRGQTKCKMIHARNFEKRQEVTFDKGQAVGPTGKRVSELSNFIGTIARNPRFITLLFSSWHAVTDDIKQRMWEYVNRASKENNEEPSKSEMFIATRTKQGKQVYEDAQIAISKLQNRQNAGETSDEAFRAVFGKEQPGRIRCYGRSVTTSSLKKDEEINKIQQ